jgi:pimeloyl-ACP methyl ester carboxylesterase
MPSPRAKAESRKPLIVAGNGPPLVLVPGIQGRWEWMRPAVRALARHFTVVSFSLAGEWRTGRRLPPGAPFDEHVEQLDVVFGSVTGADVTLCGVSYGGLVAVRYAAARPERVKNLVLASAPGPFWRPTERVRRHVSSPLMSAPAFVLGAPGRLWPEIVAARGTLGAAGLSALRYGLSVLAAPASPIRMARRVRCLEGHDFAKYAREVRARTLVITGEPALDRVVPVDGTRKYAELIPGTKVVTLPGTGHLGLITKPEEFAGIIWEFTCAG